ncbi:hypothetical protein UFOVP1004_43 [uncultured Caudovirales phage]|uniref:Uncharacterized protein n=1 Tax=uncultured Caudovirales phage TaxID=2100421 RepID=A0A6J5Q0V7_9CAUD|nr:hypothetical protein UFOVP1004_43 [uncultured Caudovirales phage]
MALPGIEAERWRLVEQKLAEFAVDIQRLWRQFRGDYVGGHGNSGDLTPTELADLAAAGSGGAPAECPNKKIISVWGNPSGGTFVISVSGHAVTLNYNGNTSATASAISFAAGFSVTVTGGRFPNNDQTVTLPAGETLTLTSFTLTRNGGFVPHARVDSCCGA